MYVLGIIILVLQCYIFELERRQIFVNCKKYVGNYWNLFDVCIFFGMTTTIATTMLGCDLNDKLRLYITSPTILLMFTKFYDWLKLFEIVSIWTQLIEQSVIDGVPLVIIMYLCCFAIGLPIALLDMGR